jgi:hypothetical protein
MKRILDATASDFTKMSASDLARSILETEGRTVSAEVICFYEPPTENVTHAEICAAFGADIITLDHYDPDHPVIKGLDKEGLSNEALLKELKHLLGLPIAVNMAITSQHENGSLYSRRYSPERFAKNVNQGSDIVFLYGDPKSGSTLDDLVAAVKTSKVEFGDLVLLVGVPNVYFPAPVDNPTVAYYKEAHEKLLEAGAESIGLVMPGSKQGWRLDETAELVDHIHSYHGLVWLIMTGSVEGSPVENIHQMALNAKMIGGDVYRLDEAGLSGMPLPENIFEFSLTVKGKRHTYRRMALSPLR